MGSFKKKAMRKRVVPIKKERQKLSASVMKDLRNDARYREVVFLQRASFVRLATAWLLPNDTDREWYKDIPHNSKISVIELIFNFEKYYFLYTSQIYQDILDDVPHPFFNGMNQIDAAHLQILEKEEPPIHELNPDSEQTKVDTND